MKKGFIFVLSMAASVLLPHNGSASEVTISHTFTSGTPAKADEVNQNFSDVKIAVDDNHNRITSNESTVAANATSINDNTTNTNTNSTAISGNTAAINANSAAINTNSTAIGSNTANITTNTTTISTNTAAISTNSTAVSANSAAIDANTQAITANTVSIASLNQAVSIYDATGNRLGRFISVAPLIDSSLPSKLVHQGAIVWILSDKGYLFALQRWYGPSIATLLGIEYFKVPTTASDYSILKAKLYYQSDNCSGNVYLSQSQLETIAYSGFSPILSVRGGFVFNVTDMSATATSYYLPQGNSAIPIAYQSSRDWNSTTCTTTPATLLDGALEILPNDTSVTGINTGISYSWPLKFGY